MIFGTPFTLGQHRFRQEVQAAPYVENRRWTLGGVIYATLNVQGSCNNLCDTAPGPGRVRRPQRGGHRLAAARRSPRRRRAASAAVMLIFAGRPGLGRAATPRARRLRDPKTLAETDGQPGRLPGVPDRAARPDDRLPAARSPYVHGDSHYFRIDKPLQDAPAPALRELHPRGDLRRPPGEQQQRRAAGSASTSTRAAASVFSYQPQIVPANRTAVPSSLSPSPSRSARLSGAPDRPTLVAPREVVRLRAPRP